MARYRSEECFAGTAMSKDLAEFFRGEHEIPLTKLLRALIGQVGGPKRPIPRMKITHSATAKEVGGEKESLSKIANVESLKIAHGSKSKWGAKCVCYRCSEKTSHRRLGFRNRLLV